MLFFMLFVYSSHYPRSAAGSDDEDDTGSDDADDVGSDADDVGSDADDVEFCYPGSQHENAKIVV